MYLEVSGVSKHKLVGMRDKLKLQTGRGMRDTGYTKKIPCWEQDVHITTREMRDKFDFRGGMRDKKQQIALIQ